MYNIRDKFNASNSSPTSNNTNKKYDVDQDSSSEEDNEPFQGVLLSNDDDFYPQSSYSQNDSNAFNDNFENHENKGTLNIGENISVEGYRVQIERFLAEGGKAHVYTGLVLEIPNNKQGSQKIGQGASANKCVIKRVASSDKNDLSLIEKEISFMKILQGKPNVVEYYASKSQPLSHGQGFETLIIMEYCTEGTLVEFMQQREHTKLKEPEILYFFHEICLGVTSMHQSEPPIIHRDLKVENILISSAQGLKVCDFGSSTSESISPGTPLNMARAQAIEDELNSCTTLQYRAPEMIDLFQRRGLTEKMDIWALGVLLYKLCYFTTPFEDAGSLAILNCKFEFPSSPDLSHAIKNIISWLLQENPAERPDIEQIVQEVCRLRNVLCNITKKKQVPVTQSEAPIQKPKKTNSILAEPLLAPITIPQNPLINLDPQSITPMRRGRPTKQKASTPLASLTPQTFPNELPNNAFTDSGTDPFEMLAKGIELPAISQPATPSIPRPPSREEESPWAVFDSVSPTSNQQKNVSDFGQSSGTFFSNAFQEKISNVHKHDSEKPLVSEKPPEPSDYSKNLKSQSILKPLPVSPTSSNKYNSEPIASHSYLSKSNDTPKKHPPMPPPKPAGLASRNPLLSQGPPPVPPRLHPRPSPIQPGISPSPIPPPKPARKPRSSASTNEPKI